jgi:CDP-diacylglycerol--serine O-phosphatidyltransferase
MKNRFNPSKAIIPNSFTAFNLLSGFFSIIFATKSDFTVASIFIFIAVFFDGFDGFVARLFKTSSRFGVELDSIADIVSFGVAPAVLIYFSFLNEYGIWGIVVSSVYLVFGAFRLARFNSQLETIEDKPDFTGLPIPVAALTIASYLIYTKPQISLTPPEDLIALILMLIVSILMVSNIKYFSMAKVKYINTPAKIIFSAVTILFIVSFFFSQAKTVFYFFLLIVVSGFFNSRLEKYIFTKKYLSER